MPYLIILKYKYKLQKYYRDQVTNDPWKFVLEKIQFRVYGLMYRNLILLGDK